MERVYSVYIHRVPNGKVYIGMTSRPVQNRWQVNGCGYHGSLFWGDIQKYGWDNIVHEVIASKLTQDEASLLEEKLILECDAMNLDKGYARTSGGLHPKKVSPETKLKISQKLQGHGKGRKKSPEEIQRLRESALRRNRNGYEPRWIHKGDIETYVEKKNLQSYLDTGWLLGRLNEKNTYLHKSGESDIKVPNSKIGDYISQGWILGRGKVTSENIKKSRQQYVYKHDNKEFNTAADLAKYLRINGYPKIVPSTITSMFRGEIIKTYVDLFTKLSRYKLGDSI